MPFSDKTAVLSIDGTDNLDIGQSGLLLSQGAVTRLGLHGGPRAPYGSFAGRTENVVVADTATAGGRSKHRRRYPRWVQIDGRRYRVSSPDEERRLLEAMLDRAREVEATGSHKKAQEAIRRQVRLKTRIAKVDDSEAQWLEMLRKHDEELVILLH